MKKTLSIFFALFMAMSAFAADNSKVRIACGPYVQEPTTSGFTVVWETTMPAVAWVEVAPDDGTHFYNADRKKYHDLRGHGNQVISKFHKIRVDGLEAGKNYRYRLLMKGVREFDGPGNVTYTKTWGTDVYQGKPFMTSTVRKSYDTLRFDVYNDIHQNDSVLNVLMKAARPGNDFVVFNGDMVSSLAWKEKIPDTFLRTGAANLKGSTPLYCLRGNHEMRGTDTQRWFDWFSYPGPEPYWTASWGKFFFIFLDTLEDKPDNDLEYSGTMLSEPFIQKEAEWLQQVVRSEECRKASVRIVVCHIAPRLKGWYGDRKVAEVFVPILNKAGISLMLCAHEHRWRVDDSGETSSANFPVVVNANLERLEVTADGRNISLSAFDADGKNTHNYKVKAK